MRATPPEKAKSEPGQGGRLSTWRRRTSQVISTTKSGAVVAKKVAFATVVLRMERCQKKRSPEKASPARRIGLVKDFGRGPARRLRFLEAHPDVEHGQRKGDAPEGARVRPDIGGGEAHEDRRNAHCGRAEAQRQEGGRNARVRARRGRGGCHGSRNGRGRIAALPDPLWQVKPRLNRSLPDDPATCPPQLLF